MMPLRVLLAFTVTLFGPAEAQTPESSIYPGRCETPISQRVSDAGCYLVAEVPLEEMPGPVFWHLYTYPTMAAAKVARSQNGTAVQSLGKFWVHAGRRGMARRTRRSRCEHRAAADQARHALHRTLPGVDPAPHGESRKCTYALGTGGVLHRLGRTMP